MKNLLVIIWLLFASNAMAQQKEMLSGQQMQKDINLLESVFYNLHPGIYKYSTKEALEQSFNELKANSLKDMPIKQFYLYISQLVNKIKCGHTFPNPLNLEDSIKSVLFTDKVVPFFFKVIENKIIITHNLSDNPDIKTGDEILSINKQSGGEIISKLLTVSRADGNNAQHKKLSNMNLSPYDSYGNSLFDIYFPLFFPSGGGELIVEIRSVRQAEMTYKINYTTVGSRINKYETLFGKVLEDEATWDCKNLNPTTAYLKFGTFAFWNSEFDWKNYIDSCFNIINTDKKIQNLVIDLRDNEGGSGEIRDYILSMIANKPLIDEQRSERCYRYLTVPDSLKQYLSTWDKSFKMPKNPSEFTLNEIGLYQKNAVESEEDIMPNANSFKGKVYLLVDAVCSSSTFGFAWTFQYNKLGTIIGEPTGGTKQGLNGGEMFFFTMPNSKIEIDIPLVYSYTKNAKDEGVIPDIIITPTQETIYKNIDPVLNYINNLKN